VRLLGAADPGTGGLRSFTTAGLTLGTALACGLVVPLWGVWFAAAVLVLSCATLLYAGGVARRQVTTDAADPSAEITAEATSDQPVDQYAPVWRVALLTIYLSAFDIRALMRSGSQLRFVIVAGIVAIAFFAANRVRADHPPYAAARDRLLLILAVYMLLGSLGGRLFLGTVSSALSAAIPLTLAVVPLPRRKEPFSGSPALIRALLHALGVFLAVAIIARLTPVLGTASRGLYGHERAYLLIAGLFALWMFHHRVWFTLALLATIAIFRDYSAATYVVTFAAAVATILFTSRRPPLRRLGIALAIIAPIGLVYATTHLATATSLTSRYFEIAGKSSNNEFRTIVYGAAAQRVAESPIVGSWFTGESTVVVPPGYTLLVGGQAQEKVPPHSDMLEIWMLGGIIALGLLLTWLVLTNLAVARFCRETSDRDQARLARVLLIMVNGFFAVGLANPVLSQIGNTLILAAAYLCLRLVLSGHDRPTTAAPRAMRQPAAARRIAVSASQ